MPSAPARFRQCDLEKALRAVSRTGLDMAVRVEPTGAIVIFPARGYAGPVEEPETPAETIPEDHAF